MAVEVTAENSSFDNHDNVSVSVFFFVCLRYMICDSRCHHL